MTRDRRRYRCERDFTRFRRGMEGCQADPRHGVIRREPCEGGRGMDRGIDASVPEPAVDAVANALDVRFDINLDDF